jgi:hypothetical protein
MPVTYRIDADQGIIRTKCSGNVTMEEVIDHFRALQLDPACPDHLKVLLDLGETNSLPDGAQIAVVSDEVRKVRKKIRFEECAIVATRDALFGMMRMFEVAAQEYFRAVRVFRATTAAEEWLGLKPSTEREP